MDMFNEKIETHVDNPKGNLLSNMSHEVKSILSAIFRDDYGGERTEKTTENMPIDVKGEMTQLFSQSNMNLIQNLKWMDVLMRRMTEDIFTKKMGMS